MLDITKMLTISTGHIKEETAKLLEDPKDKIVDLPAYYPKDEFGWFIYINKNLIYETENGTKDLFPNVPDDLMDCMREAWANNCEWLCLDCDGPIEPELETYEW